MAICECRCQASNEWHAGLNQADEPVGRLQDRRALNQPRVAECPREQRRRFPEGRMSASMFAELVQALDQRDAPALEFVIAFAKVDFSGDRRGARLLLSGIGPNSLALTPTGSARLMLITDLPAALAPSKP